jgi:hypothetical protein
VARVTFSMIFHATRVAAILLFLPVADGVFLSRLTFAINFSFFTLEIFHSLFFCFFFLHMINELANKTQKQTSRMSVEDYFDISFSHPKKSVTTRRSDLERQLIN